MQLIDAINMCLRGSSHPQINSVDASDENSALARSTIKRVRQEILANGYHFNRDIIDLQVDANGRVPLSASYLRVRLPKFLSYRYDDTSLFLWDVEENDWYGQEVTEVPVVFDIEEFERIDHLFANWIARRSSAEFYADLNKGQGNQVLEYREMRAKTQAINSLPAERLNAGVNAWLQVTNSNSDMFQWINLR